MLHYSLIFSLSLIVLTLSSCQHNHESIAQTPKNIILLIGDGMGYAQVQASILHSDEYLNMEKFPVTGTIKTSSLNNEITDSGAAGTAMATGHKTNNRMIGMLPDGTPVENLVEISANTGRKTGVVVSCAITHATPASFLVNNNSRYNYEEIALEIATKSPVDLIIGGGLRHFNNRKDSRNLLDSLAKRGFAVDTVFKAMQWDCHPKQAIFVADIHPGPVLGGRGNQLVASVDHAVNCLSTANSGFFLMVEGAQIDWAGHDGDSAYLLSEMFDFDQAVGVALNFAIENGETLVIVTSDHETGGLTLIGESQRSGKAYFHFSTGEHTAVMVPVFAFGPGAEKFTGLYENSDLMVRIKNLMP
jgi:alkaline phosphatase